MWGRMVNIWGGGRVGKGIGLKPCALCMQFAFSELSVSLQ